MSKKFKFIQTLLDNEKFDANQKVRFLKLVSKELEKSTGFDEQTLEEIRLFKKKFVVKEKENSEFKGKIISDLNLLKANNT